MGDFLWCFFLLFILPCRFSLLIMYLITCFEFYYYLKGAYAEFKQLAA